MAKKKAKAQARRVLCLPSGKQYEITGEDGVYWRCGNTQFFKRLGYTVTEADEPEPPAAEEPATEPVVEEPAE